MVTIDIVRYDHATSKINGVLLSSKSEKILFRIQKDYYHHARLFVYSKKSSKWNESTAFPLHYLPLSYNNRSVIEWIGNNENILINLSRM